MQGVKPITSKNYTIRPIKMDNIAIENVLYSGK